VDVHEPESVGRGVGHEWESRDVTDLPTDRVSDRYGRPAASRRRAVVVASGIVGTIALGWLAWTMLYHANPEVSSELVGWDVVDDNTVSARIEVDIREDDVSATCRVKAYAEDHNVVGEIAFTPDQGTNQIEFRTERRATSVESVGCTTPDQLRPR
jgi:hypothetical protein